MPHARVLAMQRVSGNRSVARMLMRNGYSTGAMAAAEAARRPGVELTAIDVRWGEGIIGSAAGPGAALLTRGEVEMTSVRTFVDNVLARLGQNRLRRLNVIDHGHPTAAQFGDDWVWPNTVQNHATDFSRLNGRFVPGGFVHLQQCRVGQNRALLTALARILGVPVWAGTSYDLPGANFGRYVRANPDGSYETQFFRP